MPHESQTMRKLPHIHTETPVARSLLQPGFEHQQQEVCCKQDLNTSGKKFAATSQSHIPSPTNLSRLRKNCHTYMLKTGFQHQWQEACCNLSHSSSSQLSMLQENCRTYTLKTRFECQWQEACCKQDLNTSGKKFAATRILSTRAKNFTATFHIPSPINLSRHR